MSEEKNEKRQLSTASPKNLTAALTSKDRQQVGVIMAPYYQRGEPNLKFIMTIPRETRIPALAEKSYKDTVTVISAAAVVFLSSSGITDDAAIDLAETIIESAGEDQLSIQDIVIFFRGLALGKYGKLSWGQITVNAVMLNFETYRQLRHEAIIAHREEQHSNYKASGGESASMHTTETHDPAHIASQIDQIRKQYGEQPEEF